MDKQERERIIRLVKSEVVPAVGCTEPVAVALCVAKASETLGVLPEHIDVKLSANILKNAMGVGIPGTGMIGLPIAIALGASIGKSEYQLEVLKDVNPEAVEAGKRYVNENRIKIGLKDGSCDKLYVEVEVTAGTDTAKAIISGGHTRFVLVEKNGQLQSECKDRASNAEEECSCEGLNFRKVYEFATTAPLAEIDFINEARTLNENAAKLALKGCYGHELGKTLSRPLGRGIMGESIFSHIIHPCDEQFGQWQSGHLCYLACRGVW